MPNIEDNEPLLSARFHQGGVADRSGGAQLQSQTLSEAAGDVSFGGPTADFVHYGVINGDFAAGPTADPTGNIETVNNPMPNWSGPTQVSGGAITCQWVVDATNPSGYALRFTLNTGAASDEAYMEQIVKIGSSKARAVGLVLFGQAAFTSGTASNGALTTSLQYLTAAGATTGTATTTSTALSILSGGFYSPTLPPVRADAAYLRVRVGVKRDAAATTETAIVDFSDVRLVKGGPYVVMPDLGDPTKANGYMYQTGGVVVLQPVNGTGSTLSLNTAGMATWTGGIRNTAYITPTISANQNDWAPTGYATARGIWVTCSGASRTVTGISATGFADGQEFYVAALSNDLVLAHASASSTSGNRFACPGGANYTVRTGGGVWVVYNPSASVLANPFRVLAG